MSVFLCLIVAVVVSFVAAASWEAHAYHNSEVSTASNPTANVEFHCFEKFEDVPFYVRGTYGKRGYFEGFVEDYVATVNFYEITPNGADLTASTGSAVLTYSRNYGAVTGKFWATGAADIKTAPTDWGIVDECTDCFETDHTVAQFAIENCFWDPYVLDVNQDPAFLGRSQTNNVLFGSDMNSANVFNNVGIGAEITGGQTLGGYNYAYSNQECTDAGLDCSTYGNKETGHFGLSSIAANGRTARVLSAVWTAVTGPVLHSDYTDRGSALYSFIATRSGAQTDIKLVGFFCMSEESEEGVVSLAECVSEAGSELGNNKKAAQKLLAAYTPLAKSVGSPLNRLKVFVDTVWGTGTNFLRSYFSKN